jgi:hypothetical protein
MSFRPNLRPDDHSASPSSPDTNACSERISSLTRDAATAARHWASFAKSALLPRLNYSHALTVLVLVFERDRNFL